MRLFAIALLTINLAALGWLIIGAKMGLPSWEKPLQEAKAVLEDLKRLDTKGSPEETIEIGILRSRLNGAESSARIVIDEYRRSEWLVLVSCATSSFN